jgi:hypothetical protein
VRFDLQALGRRNLAVHVGRYHLAQSSVLSICQEPDQFVLILVPAMPV